MVKCSGTDHSIALEVQTLKQTSLLMSSASGKNLSFVEFRGQILLGNVVNASQSWRVPLLQFSLPSYHCPNSGEGVNAQIPQDNCPKQKRLINLMGWDLRPDFLQAKDVKAAWQGSPRQAGSGKPLEGYLLPGTSLMAGLLNL